MAFNLCHVAIYLIVKYIIYLKQSNATFVYVTKFDRTTCFGKKFPSSGPYYTVHIVGKLQCLSRVKNLKKIINYTRYVEDIIIIYDHTIKNLNQVFSEFNNIHNKIQFTVENEIDNKIIWI
jgi:hypothetical protein